MLGRMHTGTPSLRSRRAWRATALLVVLGALPTLAGCGGLAASYCQTASECDEEVPLIPFFGPDVPVDGVGNSDDSVGVCMAEVDGYVSALRANSEDVCEELAAAYEAFMECAVQEGDCDAWTSNDCDNERDDIQDLWNEADGRCSE